MKNFSTTLLLSLAISGLAGCSGAANSNGNGNANSNLNRAMNTINNTLVNSANTNSNAALSNTGNSTSSMTAPADFMPAAAQGGMAEVELSKIALTKTQNKDVKDFAQKMVDDHTKAGNELKSLAAKKNVTLPTEVDAEHKTKVADLQKLSGADFDKQYVDAMVKDHEKVVSLFKTQSENGTDADAKSWAAKTLPTLQEHLKTITEIQGKMK